MATVRFLTKGKNDPQTIYLRLKDGRNTDITVSTGITISPKHWSKAKNWTSRSADFQNRPKIEKQLRLLDSIVQNERNERIGSGFPINKEWLVNIVHKWQGKKSDGIDDYITDLIQVYRESLPYRVRNSKIGVSHGTIKNYNTTISRLNKFEQYSKRKFRAIEIDLDFHEKYLGFAKDKLRLSLNSIGKDIKNIKAVCGDAHDRGVQVHNHVLSKRFNAPSEKTIVVTLNETEMSMIKEFKGANYLENARDWLIIGCRTGCRHNDLMSLNKKNLMKHKDGIMKIQYVQSKTNQLVNVPIHNDVGEILERLGGFPRPISLDKFNSYIKDVARNSGLNHVVEGKLRDPESDLYVKGSYEKWKLVASHICRRTFATTYFSKLPNKMIMAVTGHSTEKQFLEYIGETELDHMDVFLELWKSTEKETFIKSHKA